MHDWPPEPLPAEATLGDYPKSFPYYIMDKDKFEATGGYAATVDPTRPPTQVPYRKETFLIATPGEDGAFGTNDDVGNFGF